MCLLAYESLRQILKVYAVFLQQNHQFSILFEKTKIVSSLLFCGTLEMTASKGIRSQIYVVTIG